MTISKDIPIPYNLFTKIFLLVYYMYNYIYNINIDIFLGRVQLFFLTNLFEADFCNTLLPYNNKSTIKIKN